MPLSAPMAYRDEVGVVLRESERVRRALAQARADARLTALRRVLLAFAFGLSWHVLDGEAPPAQAAPRPACPALPPGRGILDVGEWERTTFVIDGHVYGDGAATIALAPGMHRVRYQTRRGAFECRAVEIREGGATKLGAWAIYEGHCQ